MGWRGIIVSTSCVLAAPLIAGCAQTTAGAECALSPQEVSSALGTAVSTVERAPAGTGSDSGFICSYGDASNPRVVDLSWWPGGVAIGNEAEDPDGTRNPKPASVSGSPTAYFTNSGGAIRFSDGTYAYTIWIYDGSRPDPSTLEQLAETVLSRVGNAPSPG